MGRTRVPVKGSIGKAINAGGNSTTVNNTTVVQQVTRTTGGVSGGVSSTIWPLIGQIPTPVLDLAALSAAGLTVFDGTDIITRTLSVGSADVVVANGTGAAGNPTIDLGTSVKAAIALAATAVQPARTITAGSGLTGGGDLSVDRTIALNSTSLADLVLAASAVQPTDVASSSAFGVVQVDGTTITAVGGVISAVGGGGGSPLTTKGDLYGYNTTDARIPVGTDGQVLTADSSAALGVSYQTIGGTGTVTSVALTLPGIFSVSGSPITGAGTLAATLATQSANLIWAGPASGSAAAPTFRAIAAADLPLATTGAFGAVKPDGTTITITAGVISAAGGGGGTVGRILLTESFSNGTSNGTASAGSFVARQINTIVTDDTGVVTVGSNQFTLPAGTYHLAASAFAVGVDQHQLQLTNITTSTVVARGLSMWSSSAGASLGSGLAPLVYDFTLAAPATFELEHYVHSTASPSNTFGVPTGLGFPETYVTIDILKTA